MKDFKDCSSCGYVQPIDNFRLLSPRLLASGEYKRYRSNICKRCGVKRHKENRQVDQKPYNLKAKEKRQGKKKRAIEYKGGICNHCKLSFHPVAFDFHHVDPTNKESDPGLMMGLSDERLFKELDKCILLCANCHRIHHFKEGDLGQIKSGKKET